MSGTPGVVAPRGPHRGDRTGWAAVGVATIVLLIMTAAGGCAWFRRPSAKIPEPPPPPKYYAPLTGEETTPERAARRPVAVMVDNHWAARPQSGLDRADIVYEVLAEGGITRFLAVFQDKDAPKIGPVRSARHYFLDLVLEYRAIYAHVGESPQALEDIPALGIQELNELVYGQYFWRGKDRKPPHNTYTSTELLYKGAAARGFPVEAKVAPLLSHGDLPQGTPARPATDVLITYPSFGKFKYAVGYAYDPTGGRYLRTVDSKPHADLESGAELGATNVIVQYVPRAPIPNDPALRIDVHFVGTGKATLFSRGAAVDATWKKDSRGARTEFLDPAGKTLSLAPGNTWIIVVPPETAVTVK